MKFYKTASSNLKFFNFNFYTNQAIFINSMIFILKKILNILYKLTINNKRVLFIGIPKKYGGILDYIRLRTNHCYINNNFWLNGLLSNKMVINGLNSLNSFVYLRNLSLKLSFSLALVFNKLILKNEIIQSNLLTIISSNHLISKYFSYNINKKSSDYLLILLIYLILQMT
jgi:small subunit ribosomal protein S2